AVAEVAMEARRDGEHPKVVGRHAESRALPGEADRDDPEGRDVDRREADDRRRTQPVGAAGRESYRFHPHTLPCSGLECPKPGKMRARGERTPKRGPRDCYFAAGASGAFLMVSRSIVTSTSSE